MQLKNIQTFQLRNLEDGRVDFSPGVNLITGRNAQGKTNLLEAIYLLANGKSFRARSLAELLRWDTNEASVFGELERRVSDHRIGLRYSGGQKSIVKDERESVPLKDFLGTLLCLSFVPSDLSLISGSPAERRRFLDRYMVMQSPSFLPHLGSYQRAQRSKSQLLKSSGATAEQLSSWNEVLAEHAAVIERERYQFTRELQPHLSEIHSSFAPGDGEIEISLKGCVPEESVSAAEIFERFESYQQRELMMRSCLFGPQRDDFLVTIGGNEARTFASQGQTRSLVLSLLLSVLRLLEEAHSERPIVLLDDVESELDLQRLRAFFDYLLVDGRQVFISGTNKNRSELYESFESVASFSVEGGKIERQN